jgi:hypothetical protein
MDTKMPALNGVQGMKVALCSVQETRQQYQEVSSDLILLLCGNVDS